MTLDQAQAWGILIASFAAAACSVIAAFRAGKANDNSVIAKNQAALNLQAVKRVDEKLDANTQLTAEIHGMSQSAAARPAPSGTEGT